MSTASALGHRPAATMRSQLRKPRPFTKKNDVWAKLEIRNVCRRWREHDQSSGSVRVETGPCLRDVLVFGTKIVLSSMVCHFGLYGMKTIVSSRYVTHCRWLLIQILMTPYDGLAESTDGDKVPQEEQYFQTVPQGLDSSDDGEKKNVPRLSSYLEGPRGKEIQQCARRYDTMANLLALHFCDSRLIYLFFLNRCTSTCIRGGQGAPGLGPMAVRKEVIVFKEGYRTGKYCLSECLQVCSFQINEKK